MEEVAYDVALSFAGPDREYVRQVAELLRENDVRVFYDEYEEVNLWGKDLIAHLDELFRKQARHCVLFISKSYAERAWPTLELRSALGRWLIDRADYILPARFDDTELPGLQPTIGYVDLRRKRPEELSALILKKLGRPTSTQPQPSAPAFRRPQLQGQSFNPYEEALKFIEELKREIGHRCSSLADQGVSCSVFENAGRHCLRIVWNGRTVYSLDVWMGGIAGGASIGFHGQPGESRAFGGNASNAWGTFEQRDGTVTLRLQDLSLLGHFGGELRFETAKAIDAIWDRISNELDQAGGVR